MGAALCLALTDRLPSRVRSLTLAGPAGLGQKIDPDFIRGFIAARGREELLPFLRRQYVDRSLASDDQLERVVAHKQRSGAVEAMVKIASSRYGGTPSGKSLREVAGTVPTLVVWGARDEIVPPPAPGEVVQSGVVVHLLPDCGHLAQVERADEFNRLVAEFLRAVARAG
jgi:pyruvate dehydrogenase E2 component (dihydrolipoamide acetyltransferase)